MGGEKQEGGETRGGKALKAHGQEDRMDGISVFR